MIETIAAGVLVWALTRQLEGAPRALPAALELPPGANPTALSIVTARGPLSGAKYRVTSHSMPDGSVYSVARRASNKDWIGFITAPGGARAFWRADSANQAGLDVMRRDFGV